MSTSNWMLTDNESEKVLSSPPDLSGYASGIAIQNYYGERQKTYNEFLKRMKENPYLWTEAG